MYTPFAMANGEYIFDLGCTLAVANGKGNKSDPALFHCQV